MTWEEAFKKSAQRYFDEENDTELQTHKIKKPKYDKKYFDDFEAERFGKDKVKKDKKKIAEE